MDVEGPLLKNCFQECISDFLLFKGILAWIPPKGETI